MDPSLAARLGEAGVDPAAIDDPQAAFVVLVGHYGEDATLDDRVALEAHHLGVAVDKLPVAARRAAIEGFYGLRWAGFEILGQERNDPVEIVDYDPEWPARYTIWEARLAEALGDVAARIEHVGSTAVPGLAAKPIVDIEVSVEDLEHEQAYVPAIESLGVALRSRDALHRYFRPAPGRPRDVQVHVCPVGSDWERDHLLFRDYLRAHDDARDAYAVLKRRLAAESPRDRLAYTEGKSAFVTETLAAARLWSS